MIAHHTSIARGTYQSTWGTPDYILDAVRGLYGPVEYDLASSFEHNKRVKAQRWFSKGAPCPRSVEGPVRPGDFFWCNPPGPCKLVAKFWATWCDAVARGAVGAFLLFNSDHWRQLAKPPFPVSVVVLRKRVRYVGAPHQANFPSVLILSPGGKGRLPEDFGHVVTW